MDFISYFISDFIPPLITLFAVLVLGIGIGGYNERRHFQHLAEREEALGHIRVTNLKRVPDPGSVQEAIMVMGHVVIASDYFKTFAAGLRNLVGGEMKSAQKLMNRARREALVRLLEQADRMGATEVWNVRFGFSNISQMRGRRGAMQVEILAWATAVRRSA